MFSLRKLLSPFVEPPKSKTKEVTIPVKAHKRAGYKVKPHRRTIKASPVVPVVQKKKQPAIKQPAPQPPTISADTGDWPMLFVKEDKVSAVEIGNVCVRLEVIRTRLGPFEYVRFEENATYRSGVVTPVQLATMIMAVVRRERVRTIVNLRWHTFYDDGKPHWRGLVENELRRRGYVEDSSRGLRVKIGTKEKA